MSVRGDRGGRGRGRGADSRGGGGGRGGGGDQGGGSVRGGLGQYGGRGGVRARGGGSVRGELGRYGGRGGESDRGGVPGRGGGGQGARVGPGGGGGGGGGGSGGGGAGLGVFQYEDEAIPTPDANVTSLENQTQKSLAGKPSQLPDMSELDLQQRFPHRPGYGTQGAPVVLWANYFPLIPKGETRLYRYTIVITPEIAGGKRRRIIQQLLDEGTLSRVKASIATDQKSTLVSCDEFTPDHLSQTITYKAEGEDVPLPRATTYTILLLQGDTLKVSDMIDYLSSTSASAAFTHKSDMVQALNIIVGHHPRTNPDIMSVANKHYAVRGEIAESYDLQGGLMAWRGYITSVRAATSRILLNVQLKYAAIHEAIRLDRLMEKLNRLNRFSKIGLGKYLKTVRVETTHLPEKKTRAGIKVPRVKTIFGFATPGDGKRLDHPPKVRGSGASAIDVEFYLGDVSPTGSKPGSQLQQNKYITVQQFFKLRYGLDVHNDFPVVNVGNGENPVYLPADVCMVLPGQAARTNLTGTQTAQMLKFAVRKPYDNAESITTNGLRTVGVDPLNETLGNFGIAVSKKMLTVPGRILLSPTVYYGKNDKVPKDGRWNMFTIKFSAGATLRSWNTLVIKPDAFADKKDFDEIMEAFQKALDINGVTASRAGPSKRIDQSRIEIAFSEFGSSQTPKPELIFVILPNEDPAIYNRVKYQGDIVHGIHTVCVVGSKFTKRKQGALDVQYFANVALKFNLKMGGVNQALAGSKLGIVSQGKTMVVGVDVTHPSPGSTETAPSVAGVVASINKNLGQWPAVLSIQDRRKEMVTNLGDLFKSRLALWRKHNGNSLPENVIVYRDGVSEGQYNTVLVEELPELRTASEGMYPPADTKKGLPRISIIIVGKRHHTRFYPTTVDKSKMDIKSCNSKNGTVVDRGITEARQWDFFLQAHTAIKGTARPAHYVVIHDEIFAKGAVPKPFTNAADVLEDLTHNMCYMFGRATTAVSICPPAYYADLVCTRARRYLSTLFDPEQESVSSVSVAGGSVVVHPNLKDTMFYI